MRLVSFRNEWQEAWRWGYAATISAKTNSHAHMHGMGWDHNKNGEYCEWSAIRNEKKRKREKAKKSNLNS